MHDDKAVLSYLIDINPIIGIHPLAVSSTIEHLELFQVLVDRFFRIHPIIPTNIAEECHCFSLAAILKHSTPVFLTLYVQYLPASISSM
jgi:hypothetical protein